MGFVARDACFKAPPRLNVNVRFVYCPSCGHVSMLSRLERDRCETCGRDAKVVSVRYPWQSLTGIGIVLAGAAFLLLGQATNVAWSPLTGALPLRLLWLSLFVVGGLAFSLWGASVMRRNAGERGRAMFGEAHA